MFDRVSLGGEGLSVLLGTRNGKYPSANSLLIEDEITVLVDPSVNVVAAGAKSLERRIDVVVNSHAHEDHFAGNFLFRQVPLLLHEADAPAMASLEALLAAYGTEWAQVMVEQYNYTPRSDVRAVTDGEVLDLGRHRLHFLHMPGHTAGHLCLRIEPEGVVFTGDLDLTRFGPYYGDANASLDDTIESLARLRELQGVSAFVSSHEAGIVREDLRGAVDRYAAVLGERDRALLEFCVEPRTLAEIADRCIVYRKRYESIPWQAGVETVMMGRHAERLVRLGAMRNEDDKFVAL